MNPLAIFLLFTGLAVDRVERADQAQAERRIQQAQYAAAVEARVQHREIERVQSVSRLEPELEGAHRKFIVPDFITRPKKR